MRHPFDWAEVEEQVGEEKSGLCKKAVNELKAIMEKESPVHWHQKMKKFSARGWNQAQTRNHRTALLSKEETKSDWRNSNEKA